MFPPSNKFDTTLFVYMSLNGVQWCAACCDINDGCNCCLCSCCSTWPLLLPILILVRVLLSSMSNMDDGIICWLFTDVDVDDGAFKLALPITLLIDIGVVRA